MSLGRREDLSQEEMREFVAGVTNKRQEVEDMWADAMEQVKNGEAIELKQPGGDHDDDSIKFGY